MNKWFLGAGLSLILFQVSISQHKPSSALNSLYSGWGRAFKPACTTRWFSDLTGWFMNSRVSRWYIKRFVRNNHINVEEAELPLREYKTFNQFFTRKLQAHARPIDQRPMSLVSPADGAVAVIEDLKPQTVFTVKGLLLNLELFLADTALAQAYTAGTLVMIRLAPSDYHRFHMPTKGVVEAPRVISGKYESVNPIVYTKGIQPLEINERHLIKIHTARFGDIVMIPVGAMCVGRIRETYESQKEYSKGAELGYFEFGGSTVVLLFKKDMLQIDEKFKAASVESEVPVKMGEVLGYTAHVEASQK